MVLCTALYVLLVAGKAMFAQKLADYFFQDRRDSSFILEVPFMCQDSTNNNDHGLLTCKSATCLFGSVAKLTSFAGSVIDKQNTG